MEVMDKIVAYHRYISEDNPYYEKQADIVQREYLVEGLSEKWRTVRDDPVWTYYDIPNVLLPIQGWKIHISVSIDEAVDMLSCVSKILIDLEIPFKHVKSEQALNNMYSKHGNRVSAGKFITIYPQGEEFLELLDILENSISNFKKGPYILTDKQWKDTNIYFRYGAFKKMVSDSGELCLMNAAGNLVPDLRKPQYHVPDFIKVPAKLKQVDSNGDVNKQNDNKLKEYKIVKAFRFSNSGGIYIAERKDTGTKCVIKEARAEIGYDGLMHSASQRLENEYNSLVKLNNIPGIVNVIDLF